MRVVLIGDSHLARIKRGLPRLGEQVVNAAVGGATVDDLSAQATAASVGTDDVVVLSVGTNDAAPCREIPLGRFGETLACFLGSWRVREWVVVLPPGVDEDRLDGPGDRTNAVLTGYRDAAILAAEAVQARVVDSHALLRPLGSQAFSADGLHLSGAGYRSLLPVLAATAASATGADG